MALYPNPQSELLREPNLLVPGKKPVGSVKIDWSHPLAIGLRVAVLFGTQAATLHPIFTMMIAAGDGRLFGGSIINPSRGLICDGGVSVSGLEMMDGPVHSGAVTVLARAKVNNTSHIGQLISCDNNEDGNRDFQLRVNNGKADFLFFEGGAAKTTLVGATTISTTEYITIAGMHPGVGSSTAKVYLNGVVDNTLATTAACDSDGPSVMMGVFGDRYPITSSTQLSSYLDGDFESGFIWDKALSDAEMKSMDDDPYQFLIPA